MATPIPRALNQKTARHLSLPAFLDLAQSLNCVGVELRNDLGRPLFDGLAPSLAGQMVRERGMRLLSLSEVYAFNVWNVERQRAAEQLFDAAVCSGAEAISLVPCVDERSPPAQMRTSALLSSLRGVLQIMQGTHVRALVEPIGFSKSSLRLKSDLVQAMASIDTGDRILLIHDTFQHTIAAERVLFPLQTGLVHLSGISLPSVPLDETQDGHRQLVDAHDRCNSITQVHRLLEGGYTGAFSFECTDPSVAGGAALQQDLERSFSLIEASCPT